MFNRRSTTLKPLNWSRNARAPSIKRQLQTKTRANFGWSGLLKYWCSSSGMPFSGSQIRFWYVTACCSTTELSWTAPVHTTGKTGIDSLLRTKISAADKNVPCIHTGSGTNISISGETLLLSTSAWKVVVRGSSASSPSDRMKKHNPNFTRQGWTSGGIYSQTELLNIGMNSPGRQSHHSWRCSRNNLALSAKV